MSKHYSYLVSFAFYEAIFVGFYLKTGIDASPLGITKQIIAILEPQTPENMTMQVEMIKFAVDLFSFILLIPIAVGIYKVGWKKGLAVFGSIFVIVILIVVYA